MDILVLSLLYDLSCCMLVGPRISSLNDSELLYSSVVWIFSVNLKHWQSNSTPLSTTFRSVIAREAQTEGKKPFKRNPLKLDVCPQ